MNKKCFINIIIIGVVALIVAAAGYFAMTRKTAKAPATVQEAEIINKTTKSTDENLATKNWETYKESYKDISFEFRLPRDWKMTKNDLFEYPHYYNGFYKDNPYTLEIIAIYPKNKKYFFLKEFLEEQDKTSATAGGVIKILSQKNIEVDGQPAMQRETMFSPGHDYSIHRISTYLLEKGTPIILSLVVNRINQRLSREDFSIGDEIKEEDRRFNNQILSTFKFIE